MEVAINNDAEYEFFKDFIKAKQAFKKTGFDGTNTHLKAKFASLTKVYEAVEDALHANNIFISHERLLTEGKTYLRTRLIHVGGESLEDMCLVESEKPGNQGHGAALTYNKKYAVLALCAIHADKDDDGQEEQNYIEKKQYNKPVTQYITREQVEEIEEALSGNDELEDLVLKSFKINTWAQLTQDKFSSALETIKD